MQESKDNKESLQDVLLTDEDKNKIKDVLRQEQSKIIKDVNMSINSETESPND